MSNGTIRVRYAKALYSVGVEKNILEQLKTDIQTVADVCNQSPEFVQLLENPVIKTSKKAEVVTLIFKNEITTVTLNFLLLIIKNKREIHIPGICRNFLGLIRKDQNIKTAVVVTASEISSTIAESIKSTIQKELGAAIELTCKVQPSIIGGLILRIDDKQYDSSVITKLRKIKQELIETEIR